MYTSFKKERRASVAPADTQIIGCVAKLVSAYVCNNAVPVGELPALIGLVERSISAMTDLAVISAPPVKPTGPSIKNSVHPDYIVSFLDGKPYKTLKRHLTCNGFTPSQYRSHFGLPDDYPMVSETYAATRAEIARNIGLGLRAA